MFHGDGSHGVASPIASGGLPGINDMDVAVSKIGYVTRCQAGAAQLGNGCDLCVGVTDRLAQAAAASSNPGEDSSGVAVESEDPAVQILDEHGFRCCQQRLPHVAVGAE